MLRNAKQMKDRVLRARDGVIGEVKDFRRPRYSDWDQDITAGAPKRRGDR